MEKYAVAETDRPQGKKADNLAAMSAESMMRKRARDEATQGKAAAIPAAEKATPFQSEAVSLMFPERTPDEWGKLLNKHVNQNVSAANGVLIPEESPAAIAMVLKEMPNNMRAVATAQTLDYLEKYAPSVAVEVKTSLSKAGEQSISLSASKNEVETPGPNSPEKTIIKHEESLFPGVNWQFMTSSEWKEVSDEEDIFRVYIDVPPVEHLSAARLTKAVAEKFDKPIDWKFIQSGDNAETYLAQKNESKIVVRCATEEDAKRFAETFANAPEAKKLHSFGSDFASNSVGENGVVSYGRGSKEKRSSYREIARSSYDDYISRNPRRAGVSRENFNRWVQEAKKYGF